MNNTIAVTVSSETFDVVLHKEPEAVFTVLVPSLPGCITYGESIDEAIEMVKEAIEAYLEVINQN